MQISLKMGKSVYKADTESETEIRSLLNKLFLYNSKTFPFFINMLLTICDIENVDEKNKDAMAYTYPDYVNERVKIAINWNKVAEYGFDHKELLFIIFHELLHNYFYHFTRMAAETEINPILSNVVTDYYCNSLLFDMLKLNESNFKKYNMDIICYEELKKIAGKPLPFEDFDKAPTEPKLFRWFMDNCDIQDHSFRLSSNGKSIPIDNHDVSQEKSKEAAKQFNETKQKESEKKLPEITKKDLDSIMEAKINNIEQEVKGNVKASPAEEDALRQKIKITKKDNFLNLLDLRKIISKQIAQTYIKSYKRASRTRQSNKVVFKGKTKEFGKKILVAVDVSGSIGDNELKKCYEMLNGFLSKNKTTTVLDVVYWSSCKITEKHFHQNIKDVKELLKFKVHSSGGTDLTYLHDWIKEFYKNQYIGIINITDGYFFSIPSIPNNILQYDFVLTEFDMEETIINSFNDKRVRTHTIKKKG